jgi:hypothetical protein
MHDTPLSTCPVSIGAEPQFGGAPAGVSLLSALPFWSPRTQTPTSEHPTAFRDTVSAAVFDQVGVCDEALALACTLWSAAVATHSALEVHEMAVSEPEEIVSALPQLPLAGLVETNTWPTLSTAAQSEAVGHETAVSWLGESIVELSHGDAVPGVVE